ncbi:hypothetical protein LINGRAHAP2_LOCUS31080 [Linum grandiflorum]
MARARLRT